MTTWMTVRLRAGLTRVTSCIALALPLVLPCTPAAAQNKPVASAPALGGKVRAEVLSIKRIEGNLVTLRWMLVNDDAPLFTMMPSYARLVDLTARREYQPGLFSASCTARTGDKVLCWATFAAPPAGTKAMAVKFYEQFEMLTGIPVSD